jgi:type III restriction enzyme
MRRFLVDGVQYVELDDAYEMSLFENMEGYEESLVPIERSIYDHVIADSQVERDFAEALDEMDEVKLFVKLPNWFVVPTPVGEYNPDWAIVFTVQDAFGEEREKLYLVRETKGSLDEDQLRGIEEMKIDCAKRHFEAIEVDYGVVARAEDLRGR